MANTPSEYRKKQREGELWLTPGGLKLRIRRVSLFAMVAAGSIPTPLTAQAEELIAKSVNVVESMTKYKPVMQAVLRVAVLEPKIVDEDVPADDDTRININEISNDDLLAAYLWLQSSPGTLQRFLETPQKS